MVTAGGNGARRPTSARAKDEDEHSVQNCGAAKAMMRRGEQHTAGKGSDDAEEGQVRLYSLL
jgi:hypothetical protein